jgi:hypothetical protein
VLQLQANEQSNIRVYSDSKGATLAIMRALEGCPIIGESASILREIV